jgi:hypothetical protein
MRQWLISNGALMAQPGLRHYSHCPKGKANGALGAPLGLSQWRGQWRNDARGRDPKDHQSQTLFKQGALQMTYRWMAEIHYNNGEPPKVVAFEELAELHDIVELGSDWNTIFQIVVTLNRPSVTPCPALKLVPPSK